MLYAVKMFDGTEFQVDAESPTDARGVSAYVYHKNTGKRGHCIKAVPVTMCGPLQLVGEQRA